MKRLRVSTLLILMGALPSLAAAQETGTLLQRKAAQMDARGPNAARLTMRSFGSCIASRSKGRLTKLLSLPVGSAEYERMSQSIFAREGDECLSGGELSFSMKLLRGSFFEALYLQQFAGPTTPDFAGVTDGGYRARYAEPYSPEVAFAVAFEQFGECVAKARSAAAQDLIVSIPGSAAENTAFALLGPVLGQCLPKGRTIAFSKPVLRGFVAEGLYWLATAKRATDGAAK